MVEPNYYVPIIPMVLVNGNKGIGTGWSTYIPNFNPRELCTIMMEMLDGKNPPENLMPWYKGYTGEIVAKNPKSLESRGVLEIGDDRLVVHITDLPISKWIKDYKEYLDKLIDEDKAIVGLKEHHTDNKVHFEVELDEEFYRKNEHRLYTVLKLSCGISMSNLVAFNRNGIIHRYENIREILQ
jgi:DNA topoisomerase-2